MVQIIPKVIFKLPSTISEREKRKDNVIEQSVQQKNALNPKTMHRRSTTHWLTTLRSTLLQKGFNCLSDHLKWQTIVCTPIDFFLKIWRWLVLLESWKTLLSVKEGINWLMNSEVYIIQWQSFRNNMTTVTTDRYFKQQTDTLNMLKHLLMSNVLEKGTVNRQTINKPTK